LRNFGLTFNAQTDIERYVVRAGWPCVNMRPAAST